MTGWRGGGAAQALLDAERSGTTWRDQGLQAAPHFMDSDGSVKVSPCLHAAAGPSIRMLRLPAQKPDARWDGCVHSSQLSSRCRTAAWISSLQLPTDQRRVLLSFRGYLVPQL